MDIVLTTSQLAEIDAVFPRAGIAAGTRYPDSMMKALNG